MPGATELRSFGARELHPYKSGTRELPDTIGAKK